VLLAEYNKHPNREILVFCVTLRKIENIKRIVTTKINPVVKKRDCFMSKPKI
jgi:hypothetical protein